MKPLSIAGIMGGTMDAVGFAFQNYIWCVIGFFLGFYLVGSIYRFGKPLHSKDKQTLLILTGFYVIFNFSYFIYACFGIGDITYSLVDRWSFVNAATGYDAHQSYIIKLTLVILLIAISVFGAFKLK
eukprot:NODE_567_length_6607_cov_0.300553.p3 type:complete len:127 gc:universal NODE_567_length_6607_cov_0.300553:1098-718(-)